MALYRKKPVVVDAEQWFPDRPCRGVWGLPGQEMCPCYRAGGNHTIPHVCTVHDQIVHLEPGDWIIMEPDGLHYYPCKDDIFKNTYEPV